MKLLLRSIWWACLATSIYSATLSPLLFCVAVDVFCWWDAENKRKVQSSLDLVQGFQQGRASAWQEAVDHLKRGRT